MFSLVNNMFYIATVTYSLPPYLLDAICKVETNHNISTINHYDGGSESLGICQVKVNTAKLVGFKGSRNDLMDPYTNIDVAAKYLKKQILRYKGDVNKAISAYNAGKYKTTNTLYVNKVIKEHKRLCAKWDLKF